MCVWEGEGGGRVGADGGGSSGEVGGGGGGGWWRGKTYVPICAVDFFSFFFLFFKGAWRGRGAGLLGGG